jgi:[acyl-carrier-protein] S-malonyltransferase
MAKAMVEKYDWAAEFARQTDSILNRPLTQICFEGRDDELKKTVNTQPAVFFTSALLTEWLRRNKVEFKAAAGHSLGEYNAVYAGRSASYSDLLKLVDLRARAMERACPAGTGAMSAVMMLARERLEEVCRQASDIGPCVIANYNSPVQMVISGHAAAIEKAGKLALEAGARRVTPLAVSGPFHSPLMEKAKEELSEAIAEVDFADSCVPIYGNVDAAAVTSGKIIKQRLLDQLVGSVLWVDTVKKMIVDGVSEFIEIGPGKVLAGLNKKIDSSVPTLFASNPDELQKLLQTAESGQAKSA